MKTRIFNQALSASAVIILSAGVATPALAVEASPSAVSSPAATVSSDMDQYDLFYGWPFHDEATPNTWTIAPGFFWKNEGGDYGVPDGYTFELLSASPELNVKMVDSSGFVTVSPTQRLPFNKDFSFTVRVTAPDGSTQTKENSVQAQDLYPDSMASLYNADYEQHYLRVDRNWTSQTFELVDPSIMSKVKNITVGEPDTGNTLKAAVDSKTGALTIYDPTPESKLDLSGDAFVTIIYEDGSYDSTSVTVVWDSGYSQADQ